MNLQEMAELARRYAEARDLRISTGVWLHATEMRLHDRDQFALLAEHIERAPVDVIGVAAGGGISHLLTGIPIIIDPEVPAGTARLIFEDGSVRDFRIA